MKKFIVISAIFLFLSTTFVQAKPGMVITITCPELSKISFNHGQAAGYAIVDPQVSAVADKIYLEGDAKATKATAFEGARYGGGSFICAYKNNSDEFGIITYTLLENDALSNCKFTSQKTTCQDDKVDKCQLSCYYKYDR